MRNPIEKVAVIVAIVDSDREWRSEQLRKIKRHGARFAHCRSWHVVEYFLVFKPRHGAERIRRKKLRMVFTRRKSQIVQRVVTAAFEAELFQRP